MICPNAVLGCNFTCTRAALPSHLRECPFGVDAVTRNETAEREKWRLGVCVCACLSVCVESE